MTTDFVRTYIELYLTMEAAKESFSDHAGYIPYLEKHAVCKARGKWYLLFNKDPNPAPVEVELFD